MVDRGALNTDNILAHNMCEITIPRQGSEVEAVKILARYGNSSNFIEIQEVVNESPESDIVFDFFNDRVASGVSPRPSPRPLTTSHSERRHRQLHLTDSSTEIT